MHHINQIIRRKTLTRITLIIKNGRMLRQSRRMRCILRIPLLNKCSKDTTLTKIINLLHRIQSRPQLAIMKMIPKDKWVSLIQHMDIEITLELSMPEKQIYYHPIIKGLKVNRFSPCRSIDKPIFHTKK